VLPAILARLAHIPWQDITIAVMTGMHRANTPDERDAMIGPAIRRDCCAVHPDARDDSSLVSRGTTRRGHPIEMNRLFIDADVASSTGFVEPHFFAGFSGGPKPLMPLGGRLAHGAGKPWSGHDRVSQRDVRRARRQSTT
jgi:lactate racemase